MDSAHFGDEVELIFGAAIHMTGAERAAFLDTRCAEHADLRAELVSLLTAYDRSSGFIQPVTLVADRFDESAGPSRIGVGQRVGAFKLVDVLGEGGMGTVFRAERAD